MNKEELLKQLDLLLSEAKMDEAAAKTDIERMFYIGKQNGLLWAKYFTINLKEK